MENIAHGNETAPQSARAHVTARNGICQHFLSFSLRAVAWLCPPPPHTHTAEGPEFTHRRFRKCRGSPKPV